MTQILIIGFAIIFIILLSTFLTIGAVVFFGRYIVSVPDINGRLTVMERVLMQLANDVNMEISASNENGKEIYQTADGKYTANSFEELLTAMATDPNTPLSEDEIQALSSVFDKISNKNPEEPDSGEWKDSE